MFQGKKKFNSVSLPSAKSVTFQRHGLKESQKISNQLPFFRDWTFPAPVYNSVFSSGWPNAWHKQFERRKDLFWPQFQRFHSIMVGEGRCQSSSHHGSTRNKVGQELKEERARYGFQGHFANLASPSVIPHPPDNMFTFWTYQWIEPLVNREPSLSIHVWKHPQTCPQVCLLIMHFSTQLNWRSKLNHHNWYIEQMFKNSIMLT